MEEGYLVDDMEGDENVAEIHWTNRQINFEEEHEDFDVEVLWIRSR